MERLAAWSPAVPGVTEILHAHFVEHAYPPHVHDVWTLLIVDTGAVSYQLDRHQHAAVPEAVTLLPPYVVHDGRAATTYGFRKRVVYLEPAVLGADLVGTAADRPTLADALLRRRVSQLDQALSEPGETLQAESRLALVADRIRATLRDEPVRRPPAPRIAGELRDLLDARTVPGISLGDAAALLDAHPTHLVRSFTAAYGVPPHAYLTGRRIERARGMLLAGRPPAEVATAAGFYDQAHLTRHFRRYLGTTPARFARRTGWS
jgi:AraC-like DNA-binding protein